MPASRSPDWTLVSRLRTSASLVSMAGDRMPALASAWRPNSPHGTSSAQSPMSSSSLTPGLASSNPVAISPKASVSDAAANTVIDPSRSDAAAPGEPAPPPPPPRPPSSSPQAALAGGGWRPGPPRHGYDIAAELRPDTDIGQVWRVSRQLVYRALDRLAALGLIEPRRHEPGDAGPRRTVYAPSRRGRSALRRWLAQPVDHLRDVRGALLLKLVLARRLGVDTGELVAAQRDRFTDQLAALAPRPPAGDAVAAWRHHSAAAVEAFLDDLAHH